MNFGDILNQWDTDQRKKTAGNQKKGNNIQVSHKKANAPTPEEKEALRQGYLQSDIGRAQEKQSINPMELWLRRYGTVDKDAISDEYERTVRMQSREYIRNLRPEARIDLHGLTRDEAWERLSSFIGDCQKRSLHKILIVHGKGNHSSGSDPVLGPMVRAFIEQDVRLGTSGHPDHSLGGNGATWVVIRE